MGEAEGYLLQPQQPQQPQQQQRTGPSNGQQGQQQQWQQWQQPQGYNDGNQNWNNQQGQGYEQTGAYQQQQYHYGAPPPYSFNPPQGPDEKYGFEQAFKIEKPKWNDIWAGILFLLVCAGFVAVSAIAIQGYSSSTHGKGIYNSTNTFTLNSNTLILFAFVLVIAFVFSWLYVWVARLLPKQFIWITGILNIIWTLGTAIYYLYQKYWSAGVVFLIFALLTAFAFYTWIPRIPFSALMLKSTIDVSKKYGHVYLVSLIGGLLATAFAAWFSITMVAIYVKYEPSSSNPNCANGGCSDAKIIGLMVFITFAGYWISEWLKNTIHTIISGVYGSWYFCVHNFPHAATRGAAKRALTYSFGSISFGSLLVAIIQFLRQICSVARQQAVDDGGIGGMIGCVIFCFLGCLLSLLEWALQFLNRYAFCHIALYGKAYIPAAKDTWKMIRDRGIDALVNECLIGPVLSFGAMFIGVACALLAYLYLLLTNPAYNVGGGYTPVIMAFAFLIGFQIAHVFTTPLSSGIDCIFVAMGWDPNVMIKDHPELYQEMVRIYPKIQQAIQVR
ncbi:DUF580 domain protein Pns1 [Drechmeria coniospora]|uniref:Protein PNS1 n=1 Tax=Drechmeria coniospora TaxID=98403 RepID=A0A151GH85_DRECN|nr:DUF580 domain protein Pns1 [Drechmeria coniospora]KYK56454.1 DUF580 domain protein Pns1 [Drechmeria coniospora]